MKMTVTTIAMTKARLVATVTSDCLVILVAVMLAGSMQAQTFRVLHRFKQVYPEGSIPMSGPVVDGSGNLYGTTELPQTGTLYRITAAGHYDTLIRFPSDAPGSPFASPVADAEGNVYGSMNSLFAPGGVWEVTPGGGYSLLWSFTEGSDGGFPWEAGPMSFDEKGNLVGVTEGFPPAYDNCTPGICGSIYSLNPQTNSLTALYTFTPDNNGALGLFPGQGLTPDRAGNYFGTTMCGGSHNFGTVFELTKQGKYLVLYSFKTAGQGGCTGGGVAGPFGGGTMALDSKNNLYGATLVGGSAGLGEAFKFNIKSRRYAPVHTFTGGVDGVSPGAGVLRDASGNLYGTAKGGTNGAGTVWKVEAGGHFKVLHTFTGASDGSLPRSGLAMDASGSLYGVTSQGGYLYSPCYPSGCGVVFKITRRAGLSATKAKQN